MGGDGYLIARRQIFVRQDEWGWYRAACHNKVKHETLDAAAQEAKRLTAKDGAEMKVYCCPFCGKFHVGHARKRSGR